MSYLVFVLKSALFDFSRNKGRTFLTSLGILIGVLAVVLLVALGLGLKKYIAQQFESLGTNILYVMPGGLISDGGFQHSGGPSSIRFDDKDIASLKKIKQITAIVPFFTKVLKIEALGKSESGEINATTAEVFPVASLEIEYGLPFTKADADTGRKKAVMGPEIAKKLFANSAEAIGKTAKISGQNFEIIGVTKAKGGGAMGMPSIDENVYIPFKSAYSFNPSKKYFLLYLQVNNPDNISPAKTEAKETLLRRYDKDDFSVVEQTEFLNAINSIFNILNSILVAIAAISLLVGGIGIMNIMYVSVTERIKEIGIRRSLGATQTDILAQFLAEAVILSLFGGLAGLLLAWLGTLAVQKLFPAYIDAQSVVLALGISSLIGIIFGVFPARKASLLSPIEAIRYE